MKKAIERPSRSAAKAMSVAKASVGIDETSLLRDLRSLVQSARQRIATVAYSTQTLLCWQLGRRLSNEHLQGARAAYGRQILVTVSRELTSEYGGGFSHTEITRMIRFAQLFPDKAIVVTLSQQLSWSHCIGKSATSARSSKGYRRIQIMVRHSLLNSNSIPVKPGALWQNP